MNSNRLWLITTNRSEITQTKQTAAEKGFQLDLAEAVLAVFLLAAFEFTHQYNSQGSSASFLITNCSSNQTEVLGDHSDECVIHHKVVTITAH